MLRRMARRLLRVLHALVEVVRTSVPGSVESVEIAGSDVIVTGWVSSPAGGADSVIVHVDREPCGVAEVEPAWSAGASRDGGKAESRSRGDVRRSYWRAVLPLTSMPPGQHVVDAAVVSRRGLADRLFGVLVEVPEPDDFPVGRVDSPASGSVVRPPLAHFRGWVRHDLGYTAVELRFSTGESRLVRVMSEYRHDLDVLDEPLAPMGGWDCWVPVPHTWVGSTVSVTAVAVGPGLTTELGTRTLVVEPQLVAPIDDPARLALLAERTRSLVKPSAAPQPSGGRPTVLVTTHSLGLGGGQLYLQELLRAWSRGEDFSLVVMAQYDGVLRDELEGWGIPVHVCGPPPGRGTDYESFILELAAVAIGYRPSAVLANTAGVFWGVDLASRLDVPAVWAVHESFSPDHYLEVGPAHRPDGHVRERFLAAFGSAAAVVFEAEKTQELFAGVITSGHALTLDYGIDLAAIDTARVHANRAALRARYGLPLDSHILLCMGTLESRKAQAALVAAFARASESRQDAVLCLVGDFPSPYSVGVHGLVARLGLADRVRIEPITPDSHDWYLLADSFVLASDVESLPMSVLEAMAFGLPVVASSVFGLADLIVDGKNGFLFEPGRLDSIENALRELLTRSREELAEIGRNARDEIVATRDAARYARSYAALIHGLIEDRDTEPTAILGAVPDGATFSAGPALPAV